MKFKYLGIMNQIMKIHFYFIVVLFLFSFFGLVSILNAKDIEIRTGFEAFNKKQSTIEGLNSVSVLWRFDNNFYVGQSIYSAALGDAGGAFLWGYEMGKRFPISSNYALNISSFIGGGGGAAQVPGDGLMLRSYAGISKKLVPNLLLETGVSYLVIRGSDVDTSAINLGLSYVPDIVLQRKQKTKPGQFKLKAIRPAVRAFYVLGDVKSRSQTKQGNVFLSGAEISFSNNANSEYFISADGAFEGDGEGYMNVMLGSRRFWGNQYIRPYGDFSVGFGGGGDIDTGPGAIGSLGVGANLPFGENVDLEFGVQSVMALDSGFKALSPYARASLVLNRMNLRKKKQKLQYTTNLNYQIANSHFRKAGNPKTANPILNSSSMDVFFDDDTYFLGEAQTVMWGDAGGYAIGLIGLGQNYDLMGNWSIAFEGKFGAAGGGGVQTHGGLVIGAGLEFDYKFTNKLILSTGVDYLRSLKGVGMAPKILKLGLKIPFEI